LNSSAFRVLASPAVHMHSKNRPTFTLLHCTQPHSQLQFLNVYKGMSGKTARDRSVKKSALKKSRQYKISVAVQQSFKICDNISPLSLSLSPLCFDRKWNINKTTEDFWRAFLTCGVY
jgi:hypothetical protein